MKNLFISFLMLCIGYTGMTRAANTDISGIDNVIYISPLSVSQGAQVNLSIRMKNAAAIRGFQFDLYLPDGMAVVKSSKGRIQGSLAEARLPDEDEHDLTFSEQGDGAIRFLCSSQYDETFTGNDGEIATLAVTVGANMPLGNYPILLRTIKLTETDISNFYETELVETTITITAAQDGRVLLDENSTTAPESSSGSVDVRVLRTINADSWSTICLPFAMTTAQVQEAFGNDAQLADFTGYTTTEDGDDIVGITVNFSPVTAIEVNHPYIIKVSSPVTEFTVDGVDIEPESEPCVALGTTTGKGNKAVYHPMDFIGTYVADFDFFSAAQIKAIFLSGNSFFYATTNTMHMKAFRAYFDFDDVLTEVENAAIRMFVNIDGEETRIENLNVNDNLNNTIYDLSGRRVSKTQHGVYIVNGKKVLK